MLSVVVCTYGRPRSLTRLLRSLRCQEKPAGAFEVVVVENGPADSRVLAAVEAEPAGVVPVTYAHEPVLGLSNARNAGLHAASAPVVAFIDDDAEAAPGWVESLRRAFDSQAPGPVVVGGPVRPAWSAGRPAWLPDSLLPALSCPDYGGDRRFLSFPEEFLVGCNLAVETEFLRRIGGFDPDLGRRGPALLGNEDMAVQLAALEAGGRVLYEPGAVVTHHIEPERERVSWFVRRMYYQAISDAALEQRFSASVFKKSLADRLRSHVRLLPAQARTSPVHAAFTLVMAGAYCCGRLASLARRW